VGGVARRGVLSTRRRGVLETARSFRAFDGDEVKATAEEAEFCVADLVGTGAGECPKVGLGSFGSPGFRGWLGGSPRRRDAETQRFLLCIVWVVGRNWREHERGSARGLAGNGAERAPCQRDGVSENGTWAAWGAGLIYRIHAAGRGGLRGFAGIVAISELW
jgi:hypothetical protein